MYNTRPTNWLYTSSAAIETPGQRVRLKSYLAREAVTAARYAAERAAQAAAVVVAENPTAAAQAVLSATLSVQEELKKAYELMLEAYVELP